MTTLVTNVRRRSRATVMTLAMALSASAAPAEVFRSDDPIRVDRDDLHTPKPQKRKINDYWDFFENTFFLRGDRSDTRALNINTRGEVPDSSWYTNRIGWRPMTRDELVRGPDTGSGPAAGIWTVVSGKSQGISPGFTIADPRGDQYFLKFDPKSNPEMATAAEVISTKFFYALGYNVPENYIVAFHPSNLRVDPGATVENQLGEKAPLTTEQVLELLAGVARMRDGRIRAVASKRIAGANLGPFKFYGMRGDDANDVIPHEHRRELRGYYVFCSWLNHDDSRSINTSDFYVTSGGSGFVKHYLIDFGSTLGSGSVAAQKRRPGNEYLWEARPTFASISTLGMWLRPWVMVTYPDHPGIGRFEADFFQPDRWKPEYPNVSFSRMLPEDAFWAARQVMRFTDDDVRAVVRTGKLSDPEAESYLASCLIKRRDKIGSYWLRQISALDNFRIESGSLFFDNLLVTHGFSQNMIEQAVKLALFDNVSGERMDPRGETVATGGRVPLPSWLLESNDGSIAVLHLSAGPHSVSIFLRKTGGEIDIVGIERH
ncbi:MAG: hypothetical protein HYX75_24085 [Acidobacteria bacterium]|nr:hypothetical protein [Acidobacteriota bacterium]